MVRGMMTGLVVVASDLRRRRHIACPADVRPSSDVMTNYVIALTAGAPWHRFIDRPCLLGLRGSLASCRPSSLVLCVSL